MDDNTFLIYQLKQGGETRVLRFEPLDRIKATGLSVERGNYNHIYTGVLEQGLTLEGIYQRFNIDRPEDFMGHSLSLSDVVLLRSGEQETAYYLDRFGFSEVPEFLSGRYKYYSTQRPVDIGTFPKTESGPVQIVNFDKREQVENATFRAWGYLAYDAPLTEKQISDYELRATSDNPDRVNLSPYQAQARAQIVGQWEQARSMPDKKRFTWWNRVSCIHMKKDFITHEQLAERFGQIVESKARAAENRAATEIPDTQGGLQNMKVLLVKPNEYAVESEIENSLRGLQKAVGGNIEVFAPSNDPVVYVMNEEGKVMGLDENRALYDRQGNLHDIITGTFFVCGVKGDDFTDLSPELMEKYKKQFHEPEMFVERGGRIEVIKADNPVKKSIAEQLAEATKQAARDNAARPAPAPDKDKGDRE